MTTVQVWQSPVFDAVRTVQIDGEPWFAAVDLCKILGITDLTRAVKRLDEDERSHAQITTAGGPQMTVIVSEPGMYRLVLGSRSPHANNLRRWLTHDVLPSIRRHSMYATAQVTEQSRLILDEHDKRMDAAAYEIDRAYRQASKCPTCRPEYLIFAAEHLGQARSAETPVNEVLRRAGIPITQAVPDQVRSPEIRRALSAPPLTTVHRQQAAAYADPVDNA